MPVDLYIEPLKDKFFVYVRDDGEEQPDASIKAPIGTYDGLHTKEQLGVTLAGWMVDQLDHNFSATIHFIKDKPIKFSLTPLL